jgi:RNA polymerase sigma-70 factor, ECF subfamily
MDRSELETLVRRHQAEVYRYLRYLGADEPVAEDLLQEVFLSVFRCRTVERLGDVRSAAAWLRTIARNSFYDFCAKRRSAQAHVDAAALEGAERVWQGEFLRGEDGFSYAEALDECLEGLPEKSRSAVNMKYAENRSGSEMAKLLAMTENGVKSLMRRIRAGLAECVEKRVEAVSDA